MSEKQGVLKSVTLRGDWARELLHSGALPDPFPLALISGNGAGLDGEPIRSRIVLDLAFLMVGGALHSLSARVYDYGMDAGDVARMMGLPEPSLQEVDDSELVYDGGLPVREGEACQQVYQLAVEFRYPRLQSVAGGSPEDRRALIRALEWALAQDALAYRTEHSFGGGAGVVESGGRTVSVSGSGSRACVVAGAEGLEFVFLNGRMAVRDHGESWRLRAGRLPNGAVMPFVLVPHGLLEGLLAVSMPIVQAEDVATKGRPSRVIAVALSAESSWVLLRDGVLPWPPGCSRSWIPDSGGLLRAVKIPVQIDLGFYVDVKTGALVGVTVMVYCVTGAMGARDDIDGGEWCPIVGSDEGLLMREVPEGVTASVLRVWVDGACEDPQSAVDEGAARVLGAH